MFFPCMADGQAVIPVNDGVFETPAIPYHSRTWANTIEFTLRVAFYADADCKQIVTPTAGVIVPEMEAIAGQWHKPSNASSINATQCGEQATYEIPLFSAPATKGRITVSGVTGAAYMRANFVRG